MTDRQLLEQILGKISNLEQGQKNLEQDVKSLKQGQEEIRQEQVETNKQMKNLETHLQAEIRAAQEDTIDALKALIHSGYENHEERITVLEEEVGIKPRKH